MRFFLWTAFLLLFVVASSIAPAETSILFTPVMTSPAAPSRRALIVVPAFSGTGMTPRGALARSDAIRYREILRLLGFSGMVVAADTRPALQSVIAHVFAESVPRDAEVAVFILGSIIPAGGKLYIPPSDLTPGDRTPEHIPTAGLDLADVLRTIAQRAPKEVVAIVDECGAGEAKPICDNWSNTSPEGISTIVVHRVPPQGSEPVAGVASARQDLLPLMTEEGLSFLDLYSRLKARLAGTNDGLSATPALSRSFSFLPGDFLSRLPVECNKVDPQASAEAVQRSGSTAPLVAACERAAGLYDFSSRFKDRLAAAREQLAFQKAMADCNDGAISDYLGAYPNGAYSVAVSEHRSGCERARMPPPAPPAPPPPVAPQPSVADIQSQAYSAVVEYYRRHSYKAGDSFEALAALYPPVFLKREGQVFRERHLRDLERYYGTLDNISFQIVPGSLDFNNCQSATSCLVRGTVQSEYRKFNNVPRVNSARFSLRFDLSEGIRVVYECAIVQGRQNVDGPCE